MKTFAALLTGLILAMTVSPADASRPVPGERYPDLCKNLKGDQPVFDFHMMRVRWDETTKRPNDCVRIVRPR